MTLYYNSLNTYTGSLGQKWTHTYDTNLRTTRGGSMIFKDGNGEERLYTKSGSGYTSQPGDYSILGQSADGTFVITYKDGRKHNFNHDGKIMSIIDRNGIAVTFTYTSGNLTTVTDPAGRTITLNYDASNRISTLTDPGGGVFTLSYNGNTLSSVTNPDGGRWSYTHDADAYLLAKTDPNNNTTTYAYDSNHRIVKAVNSEGRIKTMTYAPGDKTSQMTEADGGIWAYKYDTKLGALLQKTDPSGNSTSYTYDQNRNMLTKTDPDGTTTSYTYDGSGNMLSTTDALGQTTTYAYNIFGQVLSIKDSQGNITAYAFDEKGNLTSITDPTGATTQYQYDARGNVTKVVNPLGQTTTFGYDGQNNLISLTDPTGATTRFTYDASGNVTSQTDANGNTTRFEYDSSNRLIKVTDPAGNVTTFGYDKNGNRTSQTDANGNVTRYEYNSKGQLIKVIDALGNVTTYAYGGSGCVTCGSGGEKLTSITDANGNTIRYEYDQLGRKIKETDALGNATLYSHDTKGNLLTKTDANGHVTSFAYDPLGRVREQIDALMGVMKSEYSPKGQVTKVTDALGNATTYEYDAMGWVIKTASPDTGIVTYTYNVTGTLASKTDASGTTINYQYDSQNRLTTIDFPTDVDITYTYDDCTNGKSRVCTMTDQAGTTEYEYDKLGRIVKEKKTILGVTYIASYSYDKAGTLTGITLPSGRQIAYAYDKVNRPTGVTAKLKNTTVLASSIAYDPVANLTSITLGNGLTQSWTYSAARRISTIAVPGVRSLSYGYDPVGNITNITDPLDPAKSKTYTYDPLDRLASALGPWGTLAWTYDTNGNRLSQTNGEHYTYTYKANRLMTQSNGHIAYCQYDNNGNTTGDGKKDFVYNQNQRLIKAVKDGRTVGEYAYNGNGQRVIKKTKERKHDEHNSRDRGDDDESDHHITIFHYDLSGRLIAETTAKGKLIADYVYLYGKPLAMIRKQEHKDETFFYHNDHLGTPKVLTDKNRKVVWNVEFDPFGNEIADDDDYSDDDKHGEHGYHHQGRRGDYIRNVTNNLRFPGQYYDEETGLNYNYFRDYNPVVGRYIEADPWYSGIVRMSSSRPKVDVRIRRPGRLVDLSLYPYVENNPLKWIDPRGLEVFIVGGRGPFTFRYWPRFNRIPRVPDPRACRVPRTTPEPGPPTPELGPPTPNPAPTSPWAEFLQNVADLLDELFSGPPTTPYDPIYGDLGA